MSTDNPFGDAPNPFQDNPYESPNDPTKPGGFDPGQVKGKVAAPAIAMMVAAVLGLAVTIFNVIFALTVTPEVDPNAPPILQNMQQNSAGPVAAAVQAGFLVVNVVILIGAIFMLRFKTWGLALAASILSMVNIGGGCCILGLPFGIWSLVILLQEDVKKAFQMLA